MDVKIGTRVSMRGLFRTLNPFTDGKRLRFAECEPSPNIKEALYDVVGV